jgi:hypothetical protein
MLLAVKRQILTVILSFHGDVDDICALLEYYAVSCVNPFPMFRDNVSVTYFFFLDFLTL